MIKFYAALIATLCFTGLSYADDTVNRAPTPAEVASMPVSPANYTLEGAPVEVGNKICPVSKEEIGKDGMTPHKIVYKGKIYNLCCGMCAKDFLKEPEKYVKIVEEEMKPKS